MKKLQGSKAANKALKRTQRDARNFNDNQDDYSIADFENVAEDAFGLAPTATSTRIYESYWFPGSIDVVNTFLVATVTARPMENPHLARKQDKEETSDTTVIDGKRNTGIVHCKRR